MNPTAMTTAGTRWGILGTGRMAAEFARGLGVLPEASLVAVGSRSAESSRAFAARLGVARGHGSYDALLADPEVDVVYVATVNSTHRDLALKALEAGKPVLVEKPFAMDAGQAREMAALARDRRLFCMEAMWTRFLPAVARLKQMLDSGEIGDPRLFSARIGYLFEADPSARHFDPALGGGALLDLGVYPISMAFYLFGRPETAVGRASLTPGGVDATGAILLTHAGGRISSLTATVAAGSPNDAEVMGTRGHIHVHDPLVRPERLTVVRATPMASGGGEAGGGRLARLKESPLVRSTYRGARKVLAAIRGAGGSIALPCLGNGYAHEAAEVMRCLREGLVESPIMPLDESVAILEVMDELRGQWGVKFPGE